MTMFLPFRSRYFIFLAIFILSSLVLFSKTNFQKNTPVPALASCSLPWQIKDRIPLSWIPNSSEEQDLRQIFGITDFFGNPSECYNASTRLGPYGYDRDESWWKDIRWGELQHDCASRNRFPSADSFGAPTRFIFPSQIIQSEAAKGSKIVKGSHPPRTAIVLRTFDGLGYSDDTLPYLRSLIVELSLLSGGLYELFILVEVKDLSLDIFSRPEVYDEVLQKSVPEELRGLAYLWNQRLAEAWYPAVQNHKYQDQAYQALQLFAEVVRPDFEYFWQFEMDLRLTGPHLHMLERISSWAKNQSREALTYTNAAFYIPSVHGTWKEFQSQVVSEVIAQRDTPQSGLQSVPEPLWGVGEEADLITLNPIIETRETTWLYRDDIHNDPSPESPRFAAPVSMTRCSRALLHLSHELQTKIGFWMASEATMETLAFRHSLKAVHAQHPVFYDGQLSNDEMTAMFNPGPPQNMGGGPKSQYNIGWQVDVLSRLTFWWPVGENLFSKELWQSYLSNQRCLPSALYHPAVSRK